MRITCHRRQVTRSALTLTCVTGENSSSTRLHSCFDVAVSYLDLPHLTSPYLFLHGSLAERPRSKGTSGDCFLLREWSGRALPPPSFPSGLVRSTGVDGSHGGCQRTHRGTRARLHSTLAQAHVCTHSHTHSCSVADTLAAVVPSKRD